MENSITFEEIKPPFKEGAAPQKETVTEVQEMVASVKEMVRQLKGMGNSNGYFAKQFFAQFLREKKTIGGIDFDDVEVNMKHRYKGLTDGFDIVMYSGDSIAILAVKDMAAASDLETLVEKKMPNFKYLYPEYAGYKIYLGLAGLSFENDAVKEQGKKAGIAILEARGDHAEIIADNMKAY